MIKKTVTFLLVFSILSLSLTTMVVAKESVDITKKLKHYLKAKKGLLSEEHHRSVKEIKQYLDDDNWVLDRVVFKGKSDTKGLEFKCPKSVKVKDGKIVAVKKMHSKPVALAHDILRNHSNETQELSTTLKGSTTKQEAWENGFHIDGSVMIGYETPLIGDEAEVTVSAGYEHKKTTLKGKEKSWVKNVTAKVPAHRQVEVALSVQEINLTIPYHMDLLLKGKTTAYFRPKKSGVKVYKEAHYKGEPHFFEAKSRKWETIGHDALKNKHLDDEISSFKVIGDVQFKYYDNTNCTDKRGEKIKMGKATESMSWIGKKDNDEISCMKIRRLDTNDHKITFDLENVLNQKHRTFRVSGKWTGVDSEDAIANISKEKHITD